jgi:hypothetical protein
MLKIEKADRVKPNEPLGMTQDNTMSALSWAAHAGYDNGIGAACQFAAQYSKSLIVVVTDIGSRWLLTFEPTHKFAGLGLEVGHVLVNVDCFGKIAGYRTWHEIAGAREVEPDPFTT